MKNIRTNLSSYILVAAFAFIAFQGQAQDDKSKRASPPAQVSNTVDGVTITIDYSQPSVKGRQVWGNLVPYDKVWRAGANEATWIEVSDDVTVNGKDLPKGKYSLFVIPKENSQWTLIFNSVANQWGAYSYDESKDVLRVDVAPDSGSMTEKLTYAIADDGKVSLNWEKASVSFDIDKK